MADETQKQTVTLEELMVSNLAMSDATVKLLIEKDNFFLLRAEATQCNRHGGVLWQLPDVTMKISELLARR